MALYADIVEIAAPARAAPGSRVDITVRVKNTYSSPIGIKVDGQLEYPGQGPPPTWPVVSFPEDVANVVAGDVYSFAGYFIMPESRVTLHAYSYWYGSDGYWHYDDEKMTDIALSGVSYEFERGTPVVSLA